MLLDAQKKWNIDLSFSYLVGDRSKDIEAGIKAGVKTIFIDYNYNEKKPLFSAEERIEALRDAIASLKASNGGKSE